MSNYRVKISSLGKFNNELSRHNPFYAINVSIRANMDLHTLFCCIFIQ
ncbi:hypothetical protein VCRA2119O146_170092 [Vibrio crassostreae]|nr:hypothetical protein VCRA2119O146_170092 [Vibrio crassostreae]